MQEKESVMVLRCELKIHYLAISLVISNSYPSDGIFNPHLTTINDSYNLTPILVKDSDNLSSASINNFCPPLDGSQQNT